MAFYFYTGGDARFQDEAYDLNTAFNNMQAMHQNQETRNAISEARRKQALALQITNPNKEISDDDIEKTLEFFNAEARKSNAEMYSAWTKTASVKKGADGQMMYTGATYAAALNKIKQNVGKVSEGRAIQDIMEIMRSAYFPELDLSVFQGKHDSQIWKAYNDFINENIAHGENNIFAQAFGAYGQINRTQLAQLKPVIMKYYGNRAQAALQQAESITRDTVNQIRTAVKQVKGDDGYKYKKAQDVHQSVLTYLDEVLAQLDEKVVIPADKVERELRERAKHYSSISDLFTRFFKDTNNIANLMGELGEAMDAMMSGILDASAAVAEEAAITEYADYKADKIVQETLGQVNNARVKINFKLKKPSDAQLKAKLANLNKELSTDSDLVFQYRVLPKPDSNNFLTVDGLVIDNARSIKTYSRIGAKKMKIVQGQNFEDSIRQFVRSSFNKHDEVAIASAIAAPRIMSYLQTLFPDTLIASSTGSEEFNNFVHWAITTKFIDELLGGTGGELVGSPDSIDWSTMFVVNGISMSTFSIISHIAQLQFNSEYDNFITGERAFLNELDQLAFDDYIGTLKYSAHLRMRELLHALT